MKKYKTERMKNKLMRLFAIPCLMIAVGITVSGIQMIVKYQLYAIGPVGFGIAWMFVILAYSYWTEFEE